jgi:hypothetical protein
MSTQSALHSAANSFDIAQLENLASTLDLPKLREASVQGRTVVHFIAMSFIFYKAGDLSACLPWKDSHQTIYGHDAYESMSIAVLVSNLRAHSSADQRAPLATILCDPPRTRAPRHSLQRAASAHSQRCAPCARRAAAQPPLRTILTRAPDLASTADKKGFTPLHVASRICADGLVAELLRAGAKPDATTLHDLRTPIADARDGGCVEALALLIGALRTPESQHAALEDVAQFAASAGAGFTPEAMQKALVGPLATAFAGLVRPRVKPRLEPAPAEPAGALCHEGGGWDVAPPPTDSERASCSIDQLSAGSLTAEAFYRDYYLRSRPVLIRGASPLRERCGFDRAGREMSSVGGRDKKRACGRTAYPSLTGQTTCGQFSLAMLDTHPKCRDQEGTLPVCASKPAGGGATVNTTALFRGLPVAYRMEDHVAPSPVLGKAWRLGGSRQLFAGGRDSGAALHFHNYAYNVQLFGVKKWLLTP